MLCLKSQRDYKFKCILLDNRELSVSYKSEQKCEQMLVDIAKIIGLDEKKYFSFKYSNSEGQMQWIDLKKTIHSEFGNIEQETVVYLCVKYYITDPCKLEQELTRYLFYLQLRKDITERRLWLKFDCAADLFSYFLQDELGDYNSKRDKPGYAAEYEFWPFQTKELEKATEEKHKKLKGMSQASCELNFLNTAKWLDMYGVDMHKVSSESGEEHSIGLTPTGIVVYKNTSKLNSYFWPRIKKLSFKSERLMITIIDHDKHSTEKTLTFVLDSKLTCKNLWKSCLDQLNFFKIKAVYEKPAKLSARILTSKPHRSNVYPNDHKVVIKRIPAKKIRHMNDSRDQSNSNDKTKVVTANGDLVFNKDSASDSPDDFIRTIDLNKLRQSPTVSTKSGSSYKKQRRRESASESEHTKRRGRSRHQQNEERQNPTASSHQETEDSDSNLLKSSAIHRSSSQTSTSTSRRKHHHHHHRSSSNISSRTLTNHDQKRSSSSHRLANQTSGARLMNNKDAESSHHETSDDEAEKTDRRNSIGSTSKRQVRRRKRSKSPGTALIKPPEEILQHIKYELAHTNGMSTDELKEIPFFKVETQAPPFRISPHQRHRRISPHRRRSGEFQDNKSTVTYIKDGTAQIVKTHKTGLAEKSAVITKTSKTQALSADEANTNIGFSADSGCEDMLVK